MLTGSARSSKLGEGASMISLIGSRGPKNSPPSRGRAQPPVADLARADGCRADVEAAAVRVRLECVALTRDGLAGAEHQQASLPARLRQPIEGGASSLRREIEKDVAAENEVERARTGGRVEHRM